MKSWLMALFFMATTSVWADNNMDINVATNEKQFTVSLPANPSTGYSWALTSFDKTLVNMTGSVYLAPKLSAIGAGGTMQYNFAVVQNKSMPATTQLTFQYQRPWEKDKGTLTTVTVHFE